ncbi:E3 ubiquitin-protein ligase RNFT2-like [Babylonia areolata]|uniref:E3 ubiquitin-protein ligase RNFT2-like n=1 Tax=Babylonia areolata TaxID=304850 RepID=UPI003FD28517
MASSSQGGSGDQPRDSGGQGSGLWPLTSLQSRYTRTAMDFAQELLPNLPRRSLNGSATSRAAVVSSSSSSSSSAAGQSGGQVAVDLSSLMVGDESQDGSRTINPQMALRMEEIRALLRSMNSQQQQQQQHQHTHSHLEPSDTSPQGGDHTHSHAHAHSHGNDPRGEGQGAAVAGSQLDVQGVVKLLQTSGVFFVLLLLRFLYDHSLGLVVMLAMGGTFYYINMKLVECIHHTAVREVGSGRIMSLGYPVWLLTFVAVNISLLYYSFRDQALWNMLRYKMPVVGEVDVWTLLWVVLVTDFVVKFVTVALKCCVFLLPAFCLPHRRRGKYYMFAEKVSQLYRLTLPIIPWIHYLQDDQKIGRWFAMVTVIIYAIFKGTSLLSSFKDVCKAVKKLRMHRSFGTKPAAEDLRQRGTLCSICQEEYKEPILLACKHIFCENCISLWFDREKTCPMCRAQITDDPLWQDGSTSPSLQWY